MTTQDALDALDAPRVTVIVGTDHHPFDRLIGWVNGWLGHHPQQAARFFVQAGTSSVTPACPWAAFLGIDELTDVLDETDVLVCHGGPASIAEAWSRGQLPIVVPRLRRLGEHVDDHQLDFSVRVAELGRIRLAQVRSEFGELLDEAAGDITGFRTSGLKSDVDAVVSRFGTLVDELVSRPPRGRFIRPFRRSSTDSVGLPSAADVPVRVGSGSRTARNDSRSPR